MELFVNFCEDTIFEMQLAAQISGSECGEEPKSKDEEKEKAESISEDSMPQDSQRLPVMNLLSVCNIRKHIKEISITSVFSAIFSTFRTGLLLLTRGVLAVVWFNLYLLYHIFLSGWIIDVAKEMKLADILGDLRDPTMVEVTEDGEEAVRENHSYTRAVSSQGNLQGMSLDLSAVSKDPQLLTDIFGLCLKKKGGKYALFSGDQQAGLDELLHMSQFQVSSSKHIIVNHALCTFSCNLSCSFLYIGVRKVDITNK